MDKLVVTLRSLAIGTILLSGGLARGMTCYEALHTHGIDLLDNYQTTFEEFAAFRHSRPYHERFKFTMSRHFATTLDYMIDQIDVDRSSPEGIADGINHLRLDLLEMSKGVTIDYDSFINASYRFAAALTLKGLDPKSNSERKDSLVRNLWPHSNDLVDRLEKDKQEHLLLPTELSLDIPALNFLRAHDVAILRLGDFETYAREVEQALHLGQRSSKGDARLDAGAREALYKKFQTFCSARRHRGNEAALLQSLWYIAFTELGYPLHSASLVEFISAAENDREALRKLLSDGASFRRDLGGPVRLEALEKALHDLGQFAAGA